METNDIDTSEALGNDVVLFGKANCPACAQAKKYLEEKKINYLYVDVGEENNREMFIKQTGLMSVPAISVGTRIYVGFNRTLYDGIFDGTR